MTAKPRATPAPVPPSACAARNNGCGPTPRWGHTMNVMDGNKMVVFGGQGDNQQLAKAALWQGTLTGDVLEWANLTLQGSGSGSTAASAALTLPSTRTGHAAAHDAETGMLHVFGGAKNKRFFKDIHTYDAANNKWQAIASEGGVAPACSYHSMNFYRGGMPLHPSRLAHEGHKWPVWACGPKGGPARRGL